jgi:hypothetical protein
MRSSGNLDTSSNFGNILFIQNEEPAEGARKGNADIPVGKEDIRIPVAIDYNRDFTFAGKAKLINIAVCEISGCTFPVLISPALSLEFFWRSPLAVRKNAIKIASLGRIEMIKLPAEYIAGSILSLLSSENLIEDRLMASERNEILISLTSDVQLVENLIKIKTIVESGKADRFPKIAFSRLMNSENFTNWLNEVDFILNPPKAKEAEIDLQKEIDLASARVAVRMKSEKATKQYAMPLPTRTKIALLTNQLREKGIISVKAASIFKWLQDGHNYRNMSKEQKAKYIQYLSDKADEQADELAFLIASIRIVGQADVLIEESLPSEVLSAEKPVETEKVEKQLSLLERLQLQAAKKGNSNG